MSRGMEDGASDGSGRGLRPLLSVNSFITALFRLGIAELRELCEQLDVRIQYRYQPLTKV